MMTAGIKLAIMLLLGLALLWLGVRGLRTRAWADGVPAAELLIDRASGAEPPERTMWDRRLAKMNCWCAILFGAFLSLVGLFGLSSFVV